MTDQLPVAVVTGAGRGIGRAVAWRLVEEGWQVIAVDGAGTLGDLEDVLGYPRKGLDAERQILREYGNMSAPTVLFVLQRLAKSGTSGPLLMSSLGPGFCAAFQMVTLTPPR